MKRLAVIGASGLLGQYVVSEALKKGYEVVGTYFSREPLFDIEMVKLDIQDREETESVLRSIDPDGVIHTAAMTSVDECERRPDAARKINVEGTWNVARTCKTISSPMIYISTDYVFNGMKESRYRETDIPDPLNTYGRTKLEGEKITLNASPKNMVCRVSVLYGWNRVSPKNNFVTWVIDSLRNSRRILLFEDQKTSPTYAPFCARLLIDLLFSKERRSDTQDGGSGIYHTSGRNCIDRYNFGLKIAEVFDLDDSLINRVRSRHLNQSAERPINSCLDVGKIEKELDIRIPSLEDSLESMRKEEMR